MKIQWNFSYPGTSLYSTEKILFRKFKSVKSLSNRAAQRAALNCDWYTVLDEAICF
eukprot:m.74904 g.74904  ORF g.74904 m.74904 type:complete len:56 (+) comp35922_c0_seq5:2011-2178(+)